MFILGEKRYDGRKTRVDDHGLGGRVMLDTRGIYQIVLGVIYRIARAVQKLQRDVVEVMEDVVAVGIVMAGRSPSENTSKQIRESRPGQTGYRKTGEPRL